MTPESSPRVETRASSVIAAITAVADPTSSGEYSLVATTQKARPVSGTAKLANIR